MIRVCVFLAEMSNCPLQHGFHGGEIAGLLQSLPEVGKQKLNHAFGLLLGSLGGGAAFIGLVFGPPCKDRTAGGEHHHPQGHRGDQRAAAKNAPRFTLPALMLLPAVCGIQQGGAEVGHTVVATSRVALERA